MRKAMLTLALLIVGGCYHAVVDTGRTPSTVTIEKPWANGWIYGLVPPKPVETSKCTTGVAKVETELSFLNQLVAGLTFGIYTPMEIKVTCAHGTSSLPSVRNDGDLARAFRAAVELSEERHGPVLLQF